MTEQNAESGSPKVPNNCNHARLLGAIIQGLVLGFLFLFAIFGLLASATNARIFIYQGF